MSVSAQKFFGVQIAALVLIGAAFGVAAAQQKANRRQTGDSSLTKAAAPIKAMPDIDDPAAARYHYEFAQPAFYVRHIVIEHDAAGRGQITFERKDEDAPLTEPLEISPMALARITAEWDALHFLDSEINYQAEKQFPHLGTMRLRLTEGTRDRTAEFNWTNDPHAAALINEYRRLGDQQLFVFDIGLARQYQPSNSVKVLDGLDALLNRNGLSDPAQLLPLLRDLSTDERIPLIARNHASRLVKKIGR